MISDQEMLIRNKITGVLLRQARLYAGKSVNECAAALSCDPTFIDGAEEGREALTLPQLESLALVLEVPIEVLLGKQELPAVPAAPEPAYYANLMALRRKIVGVILQQSRLEAGQALEETAAVLGWEPERLRRVEWGEELISLVELQSLAKALGISLEAFMDSGEPISRAESPRAEEQRAMRSRGTRPLSLPSEQARRAQSLGTRPLSLPRAEPSLAHLPVDVQEFVAKPINIPYLQVAMNLSQMPAETLRQIASGLFEITY